MEDDQRTGQPGLQIVATNSPEALADSEVTKRLTWALREMTANLLRIVRGAGKPHELVANIDGVAETITHYRDTVGGWPSPEQISAALSIERDEEWQQRLTGPRLDRFDAEEQIIRGVLQHVAGRLVGQKTHQSIGEREMHDGVRALQEAREELRKEWDMVPKSPPTPKRGRHRLTSGKM